MYEVNYSGLAS